MRTEGMSGPGLGQDTRVVLHKKRKWNGEEMEMERERVSRKVRKCLRESREEKDEG